MSPRAQTRDDLDEISASWRMSSYFKQMRHTRRCPRCHCWIAVDNTGWICSPCELAEAQERGLENPTVRPHEARLLGGVMQTFRRASERNGNGNSP